MADTAASDYIQLYAGDKDTLAASLDRIQQAASTIIAAITESNEADEYRLHPPRHDRFNSRR